MENLNSLEASVPATREENCHANLYEDTCTVDTNFIDNVEITDQFGATCLEYAHFPHWCGEYDTEEFKSEDMCCGCKGVTEEDDTPVDPEPEPVDPALL